MVGAASCTICNWDSVDEALAGLRSTATRTALGTKSCRSRSRRQLSIEKIDPGRVAARPGEAGDKTKPDRVIADTKDDRDRRGCSFGRQCGQIASRGDHGHLSANQVGHLRRQAIVLALQPVVLDCHVLAFDGAGFVEAFAERGRIARVGIGRSVSDKPDHRHRRLLCARGKRPSRGRAAEQRDELAPFELIEEHSDPANQGRIAGYRIGNDQSAGSPVISQPAGARQRRRSPGADQIVTGGL
jgi:hypothetical protein